jgi:hypothetical protein
VFAKSNFHVRRSLVAISIASMLAMPVYSGGPAVGGATEFTQIANLGFLGASNATHLKTLTEAINQVKEIKNQIESTKALMKMLSNPKELIINAIGAGEAIDAVGQLRSSLESLYGGVEAFGKAADKRYSAVSNLDRITGGRKSWADFYAEDRKNNADQYKLGQSLRDSEVKTLERIKSAQSSLQKVAAKVSESSTLGQQLQVLNSQTATLASSTLEFNSAMLARNIKQGEQESFDRARREAGDKAAKEIQDDAKRRQDEVARDAEAVQRSFCAKNPNQVWCK